MSNEKLNSKEQRNKTEADLLDQQAKKRKRFAETSQDLVKSVKKFARRDRRNWTNKLVSEARKAAKHHQIRELYSISKRLSGKKY